MDLWRLDCAAESGGNPKINHFDNASIPIHDVARIDIFMNDISGMDSAQNLCQFDCKLVDNGMG